MTAATPHPTPRPERFDLILFWLLIAIVALAPLPLGSNRPLPAAMLAFATGLALVLWTLRLLLYGKVAVPVRRIRLPLILFGIVAGWILLQSLSIVPRSWADPIWEVASSALDRPLAGSISVNPGATRTALMHLLTYAGIFWLALQLTRPPERARLALAAISLIGAAYAVYGIVIYVTGNDWILIYRKWIYHDALSSTFVNRNSFATFAGLGLLAAIVYFINGFRHLLTINRPLRQRLALIADTIFSRALIRTVSMMALMVALVLTGSRAGIASSMIGAIALMVSFARGSSLKTSHIAVMSGGIMGAMAIVFLINGGLLVSRLGDDDTDLLASDRHIVYEATMDAIMTAPWTGTGYGTFRDVFAAYRPETLSSRFYWDKAHNDYLENALELGIPAALLLNLSIVLLALEALKGLWRRRRDRGIPAIAVAATILVGCHSLLDFSLQIPAVSILYAFLLGLGVGQSWPHQSRRQPNAAAISQALS